MAPTDDSTSCLGLDRPGQLPHDTLAGAQLAGCPGLCLQYHYAHMPLPAGRGVWVRLALVPQHIPVPAAPEARPAQARADANRWQGLARAWADPRIGLALVCSLDGGQVHALDPAPWRAWAAVAVAWFEARAAGQDAPLPSAKYLAVAVAPSQPQDLFELVAELVLSRPADAVAGAPHTAAGAAPHRVVHRLTPWGPADAVGTVQQLGPLADSLEAAAADPDAVLKLARMGAAAGKAEGPPALWLMRLCRQPEAPEARGLRWTAQSVRHYAPPPLALDLVSRPAVPVPRWDEQQGVDASACTPTDFSGLDLDTLAQSALRALDGLLDTPLVERLAQLDGAGEPAVLPQLQTLREDLAAAIAETLQPVIAPAPNGAAADPQHRGEAVWQLRQLLGRQASQAHDMGALCQVAVQLAGRLETAAEQLGPLRLRCQVTATEAAPPNAAGPALLVIRVQLPLHQGASWVSMPWTPADRLGRTHVTLALQVQPEGVDWADPNRPEAWVHGLQLVRPLEGGWPSLPLPAIDLPLPLRQAPLPPALFGQSARAVPPPADGAPAVPTAAKAAPTVPTAADAALAVLAAALGWQYEVVVSAPQAAQDRLLVGLHAGTPVTGLSPRWSDVDAASADLLQHLACWCQLWPALGPALQQALDAWRAAPADAAALQRARTLATSTAGLLAPLAPAWRDWCAAPRRAMVHTQPDGPSADPAGQAGLVWREQRQPASDALQVLATLQTDGLAAWRVKADATGALPRLNVAATDGPAAAGCLIVDDAAKGSPPSSQPAYATVQALPMRRVSLGGLSVQACPRLVASAQTTRNEALLHDAAGLPLPTAADFVYRSAEVVAPGPVMVLLEQHQRLDIAQLSTPPQQTLARHFERLLGLLAAGPAGQPGLPEPVEPWLQLELVFVSATVSGGPPVSAFTPVLMLPPTPLARPPEATGPPLDQQLAAEVRRWYAAQQPGPGELVLDVQLLAALDGQPRPVWAWHGLVLGTADITDLHGPSAAGPAA